MHQTGRFGYRKGEGYQVLELGYKGGELAMVVLLPDAVDGLPSLESKLAPRDFEAGPRQQVQVSLPKFKAESEFDLSRVLGSMGLTTLFSDAADLSGMDGRRDLSVSAVIHKAFVDVNEKGTEAAAATAIAIPGHRRVPLAAPRRVPRRSPVPLRHQGPPQRPDPLPRPPSPARGLMGDPLRLRGIRNG